MSTLPVLSVAADTSHFQLILIGSARIDRPAFTVVAGVAGATSAFDARTPFEEVDRYHN